MDLLKQLRQIAAPEPSHRADRLHRCRGHAATASSFGVRNESASARCSGPTSSAPARAATVAETPGDTCTPPGRQRQPFDRTRQERIGSFVARRAALRNRSRAATTRPRTSSEASEGAAASSSARGRGTVTTRSNRSSSARESLSRIGRQPLRGARALGGRVAAGAARTEVHRRNQLKARRKSGLPSTRAMLIAPSSSGWRSASRVGRGNSASSSRKQDTAMRQARLARTRAGTTADDRRRRRRVMRSPKRRRASRAAGRAAAARRPSGSASPRAPHRASAAAGCPAGGGRASSCRSPAGLRAAGCARPPRRARALAARAPGHERRRDPAAPRAPARSSGSSKGSGCHSPRRYEAASARWCSGTGSIPASAASGAEEAAQNSRDKPCSFAPSAAARTPRPAAHGRQVRARRPPHGPEALLGDLARGREHGERDRQIEARPLLAEPAGARLTVSRRSGQFSSAEVMPLRTRCFAS